MEEYPGHFDCPVCCSYFVEPLVLECSHTFCRLCLLKTTQLAPDGRSCPMCRKPFEAKNIKTTRANSALETAVRAAVGEERYEARLVANAAEIEELNQIADTHLPIFFMQPGCRVGQEVGLHFFEPRYKILIRRCWEGNRCFVYCAGLPRAGTRGVVVRGKNTICTSPSLLLF